MENKAPFTLHESEFMEHREKFLISYREARVPLLRLGGNHHLRPDELATMDPFGQALRYMAAARAYFQSSHQFLFSSSIGTLIFTSVAFKRFTDMVPMMIDQELLRGLDWDRGLHSALTKGLGVTGPGSFNKAQGYLEEPPDIKSRREILLKKRERLQSAKRELQTI